MDSSQTLEKVKHYYGEVLKSTKDLQANACCTDISCAPSGAKKELLANIDNEILDRYYGCGTPIPEVLEGRTVLDLGCGTGRDVYLLSQLVGAEGKVIGIDMTEAQLEVAKRLELEQMKRFGLSKSNVEFIQGYIEDLSEIADNTVDLVVSNCVINLSPDKPKVFSEIFRVLKPGGELYFSDVYASRRIPEELSKDPVLHGECLSGALYIEDFRRILHKHGCPDFRTVSSSKVSVMKADAEEKLAGISFTSETIRAFKLASLEDRCEDYGHVATYKGTIAEYGSQFALDDHHVFETGKPMLVCGNTAAMISETRYAPHFDIQGDRTKHFGLFNCAPVITKIEAPCC